VGPAAPSWRSGNSEDVVATDAQKDNVRWGGLVEPEAAVVVARSIARVEVVGNLVDAVAVMTLVMCLACLRQQR
jgi:hypothetical protein